MFGFRSISFFGVTLNVKLEIMKSFQKCENETLETANNLDISEMFINFYKTLLKKELIFDSARMVLSFYL